MRIAIDVSSMMPPRTGIGNYTDALVRELARMDTVHHFTFFANSMRRALPDEEDFGRRAHVRIRRKRIPGPWLHKAWARWGWPDIERLTGRADVFHAPASILPPSHRIPLVLTLHDCYFMRHPERCHPLGGQYMRRTLPGRIDECAAVICDSAFTRDEAVELLGLDPGRAWVIPLGVDTDRFQHGDEATLRRVRQECGLPVDFILAVATHEPRKNIGGLLKEYQALVAHMPDAPSLVVVGASGFQENGLQKQVVELGLNTRVVFARHIPDNNALPAIYGQARLLVVPSLYEGFGLPVLEAMACGCPVVASAIPALKETGGDAALYGNPEISGEIAAAMHRILDSESLAARLREKGRVRAGEFSWRKTAQRTLGVYEAVSG